MRSVKERYENRQKRIRSKISRVSDKHRLTVFRSGRHIYAQVIDDVNSNTIASASSLDKNLRKIKKSNNNISFATEVGKLIGQRSKEKGISTVVFDKGGYKYHGVVKALADAARENLEF